VILGLDCGSRRSLAHVAIVSGEATPLRRDPPTLQRNAREIPKGTPHAPAREDEEAIMAYAHRLVTWSFSLALALATACGGSSGNDIGTAKEGGGDDGDGGIRSGGDASALQEASPSNDGAGPVDGGRGGDSSEPTAEGGATGTIACGMGTTCTAPAQVCCAVVGKAAADGGGHTSSCVAAGSCGNGISISCEGTDNCPAGDKCCFTGGQGSSSTTCEPKCTGGAQLCDKQSDCPASETCRPIAELGGLGLCEAIAPDAGHD
jgi:hypothetical protein